MGSSLARYYQRLLGKEYPISFGRYFNARNCSDVVQSCMNLEAWYRESHLPMRGRGSAEKILTFRMEPKYP